MSDRRRSRELYRRAAPRYRTRWLLERLRRQAVAALAPQPGEVVIDVGCGAGSSFSLLQGAIGPAGRIVGIEHSPDMLARARHLVGSRGWQNVTLLEAAAEDAAAPVQGDAVLLMLVHDILRSDAALANVLAMLGPGGRVVAAGRKWAPWLLRPLDILAWRSCRRFQTTSEGMARPWDKLERFAPGLGVQTPAPWNCFVASGRIGQA